ncbi:hypothetical protein PHIM7_325 [Sinorhizobium phage phiM7]|uniref:Uncharacterized protein n=3 Tax=Emdodecavirus TaxID=1980937 RepID=S5MBQ8_9CAUD|nr:pyrophosphatase [Sinorhizobium phage phiM12]YP_009212570.1 pyrophosphatase [Sinorhizobium phage phiN3]YP_009601450.1 pyrophosphatase [Sinorhizobium phage phiM7]AKF13230.1 hypothetical protein PHIM19_325 [Sinorhizobium phage phiM19]AGR48048.2 hypothetical protein SmphiM12_416 [Sinorhizobium phage phiM12]AKF12870.1 hypothetical protein PHIM7_325 [Sinorhizobium phage phiM7]AKF13593.1 hypothetical protein PHIN3_330 [Sinorhizobium phage phiN3]
MSNTNRIAVAAALPRIFKEITEVNAKWHLHPDGTPKPRDEEFEPRCILLMFSELMEAFEGIRKGNQPDSHLPQYPSESVEIVDLFIRGIDFVVFADDTVLRKALLTNIHNDSTTRAIAGLSKIEFYAMVTMILNKAYDDVNVGIASLIDTVIAYCDIHDIPLMEIYEAKMEYNRNRADHKAEARASVGGKQF